MIDLPWRRLTDITGRRHVGSRHFRRPWVQRIRNNRTPFVTPSRRAVIGKLHRKLHRP